MMAVAQAASGQDAVGETIPPLVLRPRLSLGGGEVSYREHHFETAPGLHSNFHDAAIMPDVGLDVIVDGYHQLSLDFDAFTSFTGREHWMDDMGLVQENDLRIWRINFTVAYTASTWNRAIDPRNLTGASRLIRFAGGVAGFYRRQEFNRSDFIDFTTSPPTAIGGSVDEVFNIFGGEAVLDLEVGPRHILAGFVRGRAGGGAVSVTNNGFAGLTPNDTRINTTTVHGEIEAGVVSQPSPRVELRFGYRWFRQEVFEHTKNVILIDPALGPQLVTLDLPDNTTVLHMVFFEAAFPF
jgi:hypothetical protein